MFLLIIRFFREGKEFKILLRYLAYINPIVFKDNYRVYNYFGGSDNDS